MSNISVKNILYNKNVIFACSDPGGAKAIISFYKNYSLFYRNALLISDREHDFFLDFGVEVLIVNKTSLYKTLNSFSPDIIFTGTSFPNKIEIECLKYSKFYCNIQTITFLDNWSNYKVRFQYQESKKYFFPTYICLIDNYALKILKKELIIGSNILITGNPYFEYLQNWTPKINKNEFFKKYDLDYDKGFILYAPEPFSRFNLKKKYGFNEIDGLNEIIKLVKKDETIIFKCHPNQNHLIIKTWLSRNIDLKSIKIIILTSDDINTLIFYSKFVLGFFSNSLVEAVHMGKKVGRILYLLKNKNLDPLKNFKIGDSINNKSDFIKFINNN
jgi:hypothetical protein